MESLMMGMNTSQSEYDDAVDAEKAPEIISNVVSTLPPEQLYELIKQMKEWFQNYPVFTRNMLLQNPQLGYALLQALVRMKTVDPEIARIMLHPAHNVPPSLRISNATATTSRVQPVLQTTNNDSIDWQHNNMYRWQSTSQDLRQQPPPLLSNIEPSLSFMAGRDYPQTSALYSDNRLFGDNKYRDSRPNNFLTMPPPMIVQQIIVPEQKPSSGSHMKHVKLNISLYLVMHDLLTSRINCHVLTARYDCLLKHKKFNSLVKATTGTAAYDIIIYVVVVVILTYEL